MKYFWQDKRFHCPPFVSFRDYFVSPFFFHLFCFQFIANIHLTNSLLLLSQVSHSFSIPFPPIAQHDRNRGITSWQLQPFAYKIMIQTCLENNTLSKGFNYFINIRRGQSTARGSCRAGWSLQCVPQSSSWKMS